MLDEKRRHRLIDAFTNSHGEEVAVALAESLFSTEFATKADLKALERATKGDIEALGTRLETRIDGITTRIDGVETRLDAITTRIDGVETRLDGCATKSDLKAEVAASTNQMLRWFITTMLAFLGLILTAGSIGIAVVVHAVNTAAS